MLSNHSNLSLIWHLLLWGHVYTAHHSICKCVGRYVVNKALMRTCGLCSRFTCMICSGPLQLSAKYHRVHAVLCSQEVMVLRDDLTAKDTELVAARLRSLESTVRMGARPASPRKAEQSGGGASTLSQILFLQPDQQTGSCK